MASSLATLGISGIPILNDTQRELEALIDDVFWESDTTEAGYWANFEYFCPEA